MTTMLEIVALTSRPKSKISTVVKTVRTLLGLSQQAVAERSGILIREEIVKIEGGQNQARTDRIRVGLAKAFEINRDEIAELLEGHVSAEDLVKRIQRRKSAPPKTDGEVDNFEIAVRYLGGAAAISREAIDEVRAPIDRGEMKPNDFEPQVWGLRLHDAAARRLEAQGKAVGLSPSDRREKSRPRPKVPRPEVLHEALPDDYKPTNDYKPTKPSKQAAG